MGNQQGGTCMVEQIILSGKLGDGCLVKYCKNAIIRFNSIHLNYLIFKKIQLEMGGIRTTDISFGISGYNRQRKIPKFSSHVDERITKAYYMSKKECIENLDIIGIIMLFLDDGSYHKRAGTGNLYVNTFTLEELNALIDKIYEYYPQKKCSIYHDNKKDGRSYPYLYIPKTVMENFKKDIAMFVKTYNIPEMFYKAGLPSTTIRKE